MTLPVQNINHSAFRLMFEKGKLSGNNFNDWLRQLKLVLRVKKKLFVIEQPLLRLLLLFEAQVLAQWNVVYDAYNEVSCLILRSMTPELHRQFENSSPYDMIRELKSVFKKQAGVERFDVIRNFHACKQEEGKPVGPYVIKIKNYVAQLNYNMHNIGKTIGELHALLISYEKGLLKKAATLEVMAIQGCRIQKANKKSLNAKGKGFHSSRSDYRSVSKQTTRNRRLEQTATYSISTISE
nr:hypothetical protein [Tanacetum cinerariifolium]